MQTIRTPAIEAKVIAALEEKPLMTFACRRARISRSALNLWRRDDPAFDQRVRAARDRGLDSVEESLLSRGLKDDTTAAIFMLKSLRREIYGDRVNHQHTVAIETTPEWVTFRTALLAVLDQYPEVKAQVMEQMRQLVASDELAALS